VADVHGVHMIEQDIGNATAFAAELRSADVTFNLAGEISHIHSMERPWRDAEVNAMAQLKLLEESARQAAGVRIIYLQPPQIYGIPGISAGR